MRFRFLRAAGRIQLKQGGFLIMAIVQEMHIDGVTIRFHDDYCKDISEEKIQQILRRIAERVLLDLSAAQRDDPPSERTREVTA